jgi:signal peptidase I
LKRLVYIILAVILVPLSIYLWPAALGGDGGFLIVQGNSMLPTILPGSIVLTKQQQSYQIDDIVSFTVREEGYARTIVHRIIAEGDKGFIIKGDNNPKKDPGFPTNRDINGKVVFVVPYVGDLLLNLRNPVMMVVLTISSGFFQWFTKKRKANKEKMRRIRLGLPPKPKNSQVQKKPKKPDYNAFYAAIGLNVITYGLSQALINIQVRPQGDMVTGFLYKILEPSFASTISFALYFVFIFGLYYIAKRFGARRKIKQNTTQKRKSTLVLIKEGLNPILLSAQFLWVIFILMSIFHVISIGTDLISETTCNPKEELCIDEVV